ncbi:HutD family protein [Paraherbaspirillum soli]|uniref:HutD family protein n=1 Tax=Paraherbaspirillum soli TaxID=631222 RepID=A0ABW0MDK9_9BURK
MELHAFDDLIAAPWKNGGGSTRTLSSYPADAGFDDFLWRVSIADVDQSGPFSSFPGIDRVIMLLDGPGMQLNFADGKVHGLTTPLLPYCFKGEEQLDARLEGGACRDFNLMLRRGAASGAVEVWHATPDVVEACDFRLLFCVQGSWQVSTSHAECALERRQTLSCEGDTGRISVRPLAADSVLVVVKINRQQGIAHAN